MKVRVGRGLPEVWQRGKGSWTLTEAWDKNVESKTEGGQ